MMDGKSFLQIFSSVEQNIRIHKLCKLCNVQFTSFPFLNISVLHSLVPLKSASCLSMYHLKVISSSFSTTSAFPSKGTSLEPCLTLQNQCTKFREPRKTYHYGNNPSLQYPCKLTLLTDSIILYVKVLYFSKTKRIIWAITFT